MLVDRRQALSRRRVQTVNRLHALLAELLPGQAKKDITTGQAKKMLASVRPRDVAGKTRRRLAAEELAELVAVDAKIKKLAVGVHDAKVEVTKVQFELNLDIINLELKSRPSTLPEVIEQCETTVKLTVVDCTVLFEQSNEVVTKL